MTYSYEHFIPGAIEVSSVTSNGYTYISAILQYSNEPGSRAQLELTCNGVQKYRTGMTASLCTPDDLSSMTCDTTCVIYKP